MLLLMLTACLVPPDRWLEDPDAPDVVVWADTHTAKTLDYVQIPPDVRTRIQDWGRSMAREHRVSFAEGTTVYTHRTGRRPTRLYIERPWQAAQQLVEADPRCHTSLSTSGSLLIWGTRDKRRCRFVLEDLDTGERTELPRARRVQFTNDGLGLVVSRRKQHLWMSLDLQEQVALPPIPQGWNAPAVDTLLDGRVVLMGSRAPQTYQALALLDGDQWIPTTPPTATVFLSSGQLGTTPVFLSRSLREHRLFRRLLFKPHGPDAKWQSVVEGPFEEASVHGNRVLLSIANAGTLRFEERTLDGERVPTPLDDVYTDIFLHDVNRQTAMLVLHTLTGREVWTRTWEGEYTLQHTFDHGVPTHMEQLEVTSADGTQVPMTVVVPDHAEPGAAPVWLTSYGGFNRKSPLHSPRQALVWLAMGGIVGTVHARGGNERPGWHDAGRGRNLGATFEDVIAGAEHLVDAGYTRPGRIAFSGGSNGGLTAMASVAERPTLFGAVVSHSGVHDLMGAARMGHHWPAEFGDPKDRTQWPRLFRWSPLEKRPAALPPILITTGKDDPTVSPSHAYKLANAWQGVSGGPVLLRRYPWTSHHHQLPKGNKGRRPKRRVQNMEELGFLIRALDLDWSALPDAPANPEPPDSVEEGPEPI